MPKSQTKYCRISQYVEKHHKKLYEVLEYVCLVSRLGGRMRTHAGVTFILPHKSTIERWAKDIYTDKIEEVEKQVKCYILDDNLNTKQAWVAHKSDLPTASGKTVKILDTQPIGKKVVFANKAEIEVDEKFTPFSGFRSNQSVWKMVKGELKVSDLGNRASYEFSKKEPRNPQGASGGDPFNATLPGGNKSEIVDKVIADGLMSIGGSKHGETVKKPYDAPIMGLVVALSNLDSWNKDGKRDGLLSESCQIANLMMMSQILSDEDFHAVYNTPVFTPEKKNKKHFSDDPAALLSTGTDFRDDAVYKTVASAMDLPLEVLKNYMAAMYAESMTFLPLIAELSAQQLSKYAVVTNIKDISRIGNMVRSMGGGNFNIVGSDMHRYLPGDVQQTMGGMNQVVSGGGTALGGSSTAIYEANFKQNGGMIDWGLTNPKLKESMSMWICRLVASARSNGIVIPDAVAAPVTDKASGGEASPDPQDVIVEPQDLEVSGPEPEVAGTFLGGGY